MTRREYPDAPIVAVGAIVLDEARDRVLLIRRGQEPMRSEWSLPGGAVELGETLQEAVTREVYEETGLVVRPLRLAATFDRIYREPDTRSEMEPGLERSSPPASAGRVRYHYVLIDFLCEVTGGALACASDTTEAAWAKREELHNGEPYRLAEFTVKVLREALMTK